MIYIREYSSNIPSAAHKSSLTPSFLIVNGLTSHNFKRQHKHSAQNHFLPDRVLLILSLKNNAINIIKESCAVNTIGKIRVKWKNIYSTQINTKPNPKFKSMGLHSLKTHSQPCTCTGLLLCINSKENTNLMVNKMSSTFMKCNSFLPYYSNP